MLKLRVKELVIIDYKKYINLEESQFAESLDCIIGKGSSKHDCDGCYFKNSDFTNSNLVQYD